MPNPVQLLHTGGVPAPAAQIFYAEVSSNQPLPTSFSDPLYVVVPDWTTDFFYTITGWPPLYGVTKMPKAADPCMVVRDNRGNLRCVWWTSPDDVYVTAVPARATSFAAVSAVSHT